MKIVSAVFVVLLCCMLTLPGHAEAISHDFENANIADIASYIAKQGNVEVIVSTRVKGQVQQLHLDKVTPEEALQKLAAAADLVVWKAADKTYVLSKKPKAKGAVIKPTKQDAVIAKDADIATNTEQNAVIAIHTKPYLIKIRFDDGFAQEIQVDAQDSFSVATTSGETQWEIKGANKLDGGGMTINLMIHRAQPKAGAKLMQTLESKQRTQFDGVEVTATADGLSVFVSISKTAS